MTRKLSRIILDEIISKINSDWFWGYTAIDLDSRLIFDVAVFERRGIDPVVAFLYKLAEKHDLSDTLFFVSGYGYLTALSRVRLSGQLDYVYRNHFEKWFHTLKLRIDRFHNSWVGSRASVREWLEQFVPVERCTEYHRPKGPLSY